MKKGVDNITTMVHKGIKLAYDDQGAGKPAFVFVHGFTCDRSFFSPQVAHFARLHRVISVDLRGHGESDKPKGSYPINAYADDIAHIIDHLELGKVVAVGHSMGADTVLQLAASYPDHVTAIVMMDPDPFVFPSEVRKGYEAIAKAFEAGNQEPWRQQITTQGFLSTSDRKLVEDVTTVMMAASSHVAASAFHGILEFDGKALAEHCKVPALHLAPMSPSNPPHLMSEWLPSVVNGLVVGAGHFIQLEVPDQVNAMIEGFLRHYI